ncbi:MAG: S24 family peptidase [Bacteroidota bacterium]
MESKNELEALIESIKANTGLTQEQIATRMNYTRSYLSEVKKSGGTPKIISALKREFKEELEKPTHDLTNSSGTQDSETDQKPTYLERRRGKKLKSEPVLVPFMPIKAQAGYVRALDQEMFVETLDKYSLPPGVDPKGAVLRYWEIQGDSMEGKDDRGFKEGDIILTSEVPRMDWDQLRNFYVYVIVTDEAVLIKRIFCKNALEWVLISENEDLYPQQLLPAETVKEVWLYRRTWKMDAAPTKRFEIKV